MNKMFKDLDIFHMSWNEIHPAKLDYSFCIIWWSEGYGLNDFLAVLYFFRFYFICTQGSGLEDAFLLQGYIFLPKFRHFLVKTKRFFTNIINYSSKRNP